jgi:hypothetical protein
LENPLRRGKEGEGGGRVNKKGGGTNNAVNIGYFAVSTVHLRVGVEKKPAMKETRKKGKWARHISE